MCGSGYSFLLCDEFLAREEEEEVAARKPPKEWRKSMSKVRRNGRICDGM